MTTTIMTESEFWATFHPVRYEGDLAEVDLHHLWTVIEIGDEDDRCAVVNGDARMNRCGHYVSHVPWPDDAEIEVQLDDPCADCRKSLREHGAKDAVVAGDRLRLCAAIRVAWAISHREPPTPEELEKLIAGVPWGDEDAYLDWLSDVMNDLA